MNFKTSLSIGWILLSASCFGAAEGTYLVPSKDYQENLPAWKKDYRSLWEKVLFVTPGELARFTKIGGMESEEFAVSVWKRRHEAKDEYWVTVTISPVFIWPPLQRQGFDRSSMSQMKPKRCDMRIPESTALAVHRAWRKMLREVRRDPSLYVGVDNPTIIFSTMDMGKVLRGELPSNPKGNPIRLTVIAQSLGELCLTPSADLPRHFQEIEKMAIKIVQ